MSLSENLKVLFALNCPGFEAEVDNDMVYVHKGKMTLLHFQGAITEAGGIKALVDLIFKWPSSSDGILVCILHI